jgi:transcriptional antiterminator
MSDMSFKQAKELTEQLELTEVTLTKTLQKIEKAAVNFDDSLKKQEGILNYVPIVDNRLNILKIVVATNIGFVIGLLVSKYLI